MPKACEERNGRGGLKVRVVYAERKAAACHALAISVRESRLREESRTIGGINVSRSANEAATMARWRTMDEGHLDDTQ